MPEPQLDAEMMEKLAGAVAFICGAQHECTVALRKAAESRSASDIKRAHAQFKKLKPAERAAALNMVR